MLNGYGDIDVGMVFPVAGAVPGFIVDAAGHDKLGCCANPLAVIASEYGLALGVGVGYQEALRLAVAGRRGETDYIEHVEDSTASDRSR